MQVLGLVTEARAYAQSGASAMLTQRRLGEATDQIADRVAQVVRWMTGQRRIATEWEIAVKEFVASREAFMSTYQRDDTKVS